jgi:hypothetical protein
VISHDSFPVEPWQVRETELDIDLLDESESLFALSNGHIGLRGNLDEGEPHGHCLTPRRDLATQKQGRPSSTSPTARSCGYWSTTSRSTSATAS